MMFVKKEWKLRQQLLIIWNKEQGFIKAMWCGNPDCEAKIKELTSAKSRCIPFEKEDIGDTCVCCGKKADKFVIWGRQY